MEIWILPLLIGIALTLRFVYKSKSALRFCKDCGQTGYPKRRTRGSLGIEILLWCLFLLPGLIYSIWRLTTRHDACRFCASAALIPPDSPVAKKQIAELK